MVLPSKWSAVSKRAFGSQPLPIFLHVGVALDYNCTCTSPTVPNLRPLRLPPPCPGLPASLRAGWGRCEDAGGANSVGCFEPDLSLKKIGLGVQHM